MKYFIEFVAYKIADLLKAQGKLKNRKKYFDFIDQTFWQLVNDYDNTICLYGLNDEELTREFLEGRN